MPRPRRVSAELDLVVTVRGAEVAAEELGAGWMAVVSGAEDESGAT